MAELNRRMQLLLSEEQFDFYKALSEKRGQPVSELIRRAMDETFRPATNVSSLQALRKIRHTTYAASDASAAPGVQVGDVLGWLEESRAP